MNAPPAVSAANHSTRPSQRVCPPARTLWSMNIQSRSATLLVMLAVGVVLSFGGHASADEKDDRLKVLEKRLELLEKRLDGRSDGRGEAPKPGSTLSVGASGFSLRSADTNFTLRIRGLLQADSRWYLDDGGIGDNDGFVLRRVRPILEGTVFRDFDFLITPEFGGSSPVIRGP